VVVGAAAATSAYGLRMRRRLHQRTRTEQRRRAVRPAAPGSVRFSVVIPAYCEGHRIAKSVERVRDALGTLDAVGDLEVIVVDDGSPDDTAEQARTVADQVLVLPSNRGKGAAVRHGMLAARGRTLAFTDADLSYAPEQLASLLKEVEDGWDVVVGSRKHVDATTLVQGKRLRELSGRVFNVLTFIVLLGHYRDTQCGLKAFRADVGRELFDRTRIDRFAFDVELFHLVERYGLSLREVPVTLEHAETSTVRVGMDALRMVRDLMRIRWYGMRRYYRLDGPDHAGQGVAPASGSTSD
jgi:glycosyltransferase involved in cell wall biosynthesis